MYFDSVSAGCGHLAPLFLGHGEAEHHGQDPAVEQIVPPHSREERHVWRLVVAHMVNPMTSVLLLCATSAYTCPQLPPPAHTKERNAEK